MKKTALLEAMKEFLDTSKRVSNLYDDLDEATKDLFAEKYPFEVSFDEVVLEIEAWVDNLESKNKNSI